MPAASLTAGAAGCSASPSSCMILAPHLCAPAVVPAPFLPAGAAGSAGSLSHCMILATSYLLHSCLQEHLAELAAQHVACDSEQQAFLRAKQNALMDTEFLLPLRQGQIEVASAKSGMEDIAHAVLLDRRQVSKILEP